MKTLCVVRKMAKWALAGILKSIAAIVVGGAACVGIALGVDWLDGVGWLNAIGDIVLWVIGCILCVAVVRGMVEETINQYRKFKRECEE